MEIIKKYGLKIDKTFFDFIKNEYLLGISINNNDFWKFFSDLIYKNKSRNAELLYKRKLMQNKIDIFWMENNSVSIEKQIEFLKSINYLVPEQNDFEITTNNIDQELKIPSPQLIVPINNKRYALNAVNSRWGSLFDSLYGSDVIDHDPSIPRRELVFQYVNNILDQIIPIKFSLHKYIKNYCIVDEKLFFKSVNGKYYYLLDTTQLKEYNITDTTQIFLFENNGLKIKILINKNNDIGKYHNCGIMDVIIESALSVLMDMEDASVAVDTEDKIVVYQNWLGLMKSDLNCQFEKNNRIIKRELCDDFIIKNKIKSRALIMVRNCGMSMYSDIIKTEDDDNIPEGLLDLFMTVVGALHNIEGNCIYKNSIYNSIYIVKPKMHGPEEVEYINDTFIQVEQLLGLPINTIKLGIMDEERRTSINLKECIRMAKERIFFINTGFLDRVGDEIHTMMEAGPVMRKDDIKKTIFLDGYEKWNVDIGLRCGFYNRAQIGKGMWAAPNSMKEMMEKKINHLKAGASTSWVPSPTASTLHAIHYHLIDVLNVQRNLLSQPDLKINDMLNIPLLNQNLSKEQILRELDSNVQSILGYVSKWIEEGIGCSTVLNIDNIGLMEDRATLRISSQILANWLRHGVITLKELMVSFNSFGENISSLSMDASIEQVLLGTKITNGYVEDVLHNKRKLFKLLNN